MSSTQLMLRHAGISMCYYHSAVRTLDCISSSTDINMNCPSLLLNFILDNSDISTSQEDIFCLAILRIQLSLYPMAISMDDTLWDVGRDDVDVHFERSGKCPLLTGPQTCSALSFIQSHCMSNNFREVRPTVAEIVDSHYSLSHPSLFAPLTHSHTSQLTPALPCFCFHRKDSKSSS